MTRIAENARTRVRHSAPNVLVVGPGRSGTTWVAELLSHTAGTEYLHEPDCIAVPFAGRARAGLGELPYVASDDDAPEDYRRLWDVAFGSRRRWPPNEVARRLYANVAPSELLDLAEPERPSPSLCLRAATWLARPNCTRGAGPRVVKSVNAGFALEWLMDRYHPTVVLVRRNPLDMVASWYGLWQRSVEEARNAENREGYIDERGLEPRLQRWGVPRSPGPDDLFAEAAWVAGLMMSTYQEVAEQHPEIRVAEHERLCVDPVNEFRHLVSDVGLEWTPACDKYLEESNTPGTGYDTKRITAEQPGKWRGRLTDDQVQKAREILAPFPIARLYPELKP